MSRGLLPLSCLACAMLAAPAAPAAAAAPFKPIRFSVVVRGTGPDVILIPGLASARAVWNSTAAALP
ncbi:MAG TPA: alpha/beta hydrolase, partial [Allosphingosinicella sp.]|nr:alpha/beta hydrolase [Allosphingosinicella sp.]